MFSIQDRLDAYENSDDVFLAKLVFLESKCGPNDILRNLVEHAYRVWNTLHKDKKPMYPCWAAHDGKESNARVATGDYYCDGMLSWEDICDALQPAVDAGLITIHHEGA